MGYRDGPSLILAVVAPPETVSQRATAWLLLHLLCRWLQRIDDW